MSVVVNAPHISQIRLLSVLGCSAVMETRCSDLNWLCFLSKLICLLGLCCSYHSNEIVIMRIRTCSREGYNVITMNAYKGSEAELNLVKWNIDYFIDLIIVKEYIVSILTFCFFGHLLQNNKMAKKWVFISQQLPQRRIIFYFVYIILIRNSCQGKEHCLRKRYESINAYWRVLQDS